jgi:hypothetical protein
MDQYSPDPVQSVIKETHLIQYAPKQKDRTLKHAPPLRFK